MVTMSRVNSCVTRSASSRFTTKRAILPSYEFTPGPRGGAFVFPDARLSSKQKAPRGKETRPSSLFYGKGGTKFPNTVNETLASKTFRPPTGSRALATSTHRNTLLGRRRKQERGKGFV